MTSALLESAGVLAQIIDAAPGALIVTSVDGRMLLVNRQTEALFGFTRDELVGQKVDMLVPDRFAGEHPRHRAGFYLDASVRPMGAGRDLYGRRRDGSEVPVEIGLNPLRTEHGTLILAAIVDLSERKLLESELRLRVQELAGVDRQKNEFLAMLGHELRNPLAPMQNAIQILTLQSDPPPAQQHAREILERQMHQLVRLVDDLLDVARIIGGRIELRRAPIDLNAAVERGLETAQPVLESRGHAAVTTLHPEPLPVDGDLVRLSQVVANLLTNAARYSPQPGPVFVTTGAADGEVFVSVRDEGIGIDAELLPQVFDLFVQGATSLARTQGGLGVGLTLVKRLVTLHGGSVVARSDGPGQGSEFRVSLPRRAAVATNGAEAGVRAEAVRHRRVLVVDDNVDAAESVATILRVAGHVVRTVHDGLGALRTARAFRPDVIVLDIGLPDITGYEVAQRLRATPDFARVPVVAVTGYGQESDRRRAYDAGIDHHLTKPVDMQALESWIGGA